MTASSAKKSTASPIIKRGVLRVTPPEEESAVEEFSSGEEISNRDGEPSMNNAGFLLTNEPDEEPHSPVQEEILIDEPSLLAEPQKRETPLLMIEETDFELQIRVSDIDIKEEKEALLEELEALFQASEEKNKSWLVDLSLLAHFPLPLIGALHSYKERLDARGEILLLILGDESRIPEAMLSRLQKSFSCTS